MISDLFQELLVRYDLRKFGFSKRVVNTWNSLPNWVVCTYTADTFKARLDKCWHSQDQRICKPPQAARMETNGPTGYEKRNLGQMCHTLVCRRAEPAGSTMPLISLELSDTES